MILAVLSQAVKQLDWSFCHVCRVKKLSTALLTTLNSAKFVIQMWKVKKLQTVAERVLFSVKLIPLILFSVIS